MFSTQSDNWNPICPYFGSLFAAEFEKPKTGTSGEVLRAINIFKAEMIFAYGYRNRFQLVNPFPHNDTFWRPREASLLKTLWEKEKLLVMSNFSFSHSVFYLFRELSAIFIKFKIVVCNLFTLDQSKILSSGNGLNSLQNNKILDWSKFKALILQKTNLNEKLKFGLRRSKTCLGKGDNAGNQHFVLFPIMLLKALSVSRTCKIRIHTFNWYWESSRNEKNTWYVTFSWKRIFKICV